MRRWPSGFVHGRKMNVPPDPPMFASMAPFVTTIEKSLNAPANVWTPLNGVDVEGILESQFGISPSSYAFSVLNAKVWLVEPNQKLSVQFFDINSTGSPAQIELSDWGAPTRYSAVGFQYSISDRATTVQGGSSAGLLAISHSLASAARVMVRFTIRLKFKSLAGPDLAARETTSS